MAAEKRRTHVPTSAQEAQGHRDSKKKQSPSQKKESITQGLSIFKDESHFKHIPPLTTGQVITALKGLLERAIVSPLSEKRGKSYLTVVERGALEESLRIYVALHALK